MLRDESGVRPESMDIILVGATVESMVPCVAMHL